MKFRDNFFISFAIGDGPSQNRDGIPDPFVRYTIRLGWRDVLRVLWHQRLTIQVSPANREVADNVMRVLNVEPEATP